MIKKYLVSMSEELHEDLRNLMKNYAGTMNDFIVKAIKEKIQKESKN